MLPIKNASHKAQIINLTMSSAFPDVESKIKKIGGTINIGSNLEIPLYFHHNIWVCHFTNCTIT